MWTRPTENIVAQTHCFNKSELYLCQEIALLKRPKCKRPPWEICVSSLSELCLRMRGVFLCNT
jgi:hypothetical protein